MVENLVEKQLLAAASFAEQEKDRLANLRKDLGDEEWAISIGESVVSHTIMTTDDEIWFYGNAIMRSLMDSLEEIKNKPDLSQKCMSGMLKEMARRGFFKKVE